MSLGTFDDKAEAPAGAGASRASLDIGIADGAVDPSGAGAAGGLLGDSNSATDAAGADAVVSGAPRDVRDTSAKFVGSIDLSGADGAATDIVPAADGGA